MPKKVGDPNWTSKQKSKNTRLLNIRLPRELDPYWREAVRLSGCTQTEIVVELIKAFIQNQEHINKDVNEMIETLEEKRDINNRKVVASSLDDAIANLKRKHNDPD